MTSELIIVSLVSLMLVLIVLLALCWILRHSRRNFTELQISAGDPARVLTIKAEPGHAKELLDHLLDRVFVMVETGTEPGDECEQEPRGEPREELGECESHSESHPEFSSAPSLLDRAVHTFPDKLHRWITFASPPPATPLPPPPPPPPPTTNQDHTDDLSPHRSDATQGASLTSQDSSCSSCKEEHNESQL